VADRPSRPGSSGSSGKAQGAKRRPTGNAPKPLGDVSGVTQGGLDYRNPNMQVGYDVEAGVAFTVSNYYDGDEWAPQGWGPDRIAQLQEAMVAAGLLSGDFNLGVWMDESANAFKKLLAHANRAGVGYEDALVQLSSSNTASLRGGGGGGGGSGRAPFAARLSNPEDLREVFKQSAYNLQLDQMVSAYHQIETSSQAAAYGGGTAVEQPSADTFAEGQLEELDPEGVKAGRMAGFVGVLEGLLRGG
jgi:hypothetical protein